MTSRLDTMPCPSCGAPCPVLTSKTGRPYWTCPACWAQVFIRGEEGIRKLNALLKTGRR